MTSPSILFVPDGGPRIGGGHVMRCLTLAKAMQARGATCAFVASPFTAALLERFGDASIGRIPVADESPAALMAHATAAAQTYDAVVFDHFGLCAEQHELMRGDGRVLMAVDDLADRPLSVDLLLDPGPARQAADYDRLTPAGARLLLGPQYALVRPEFAAVRDEATARRSATPEVGRVLVSLGLTDVGAITGKVVNRLLPRLGEAALDVVLGSGAPSLDGMQRLAARDPRVVVHVETEDMAALTAAADLAVGAGGSSLWERCAVGLPGVLVVLADNQLPASLAVEAGGAAVIADARAADFDAALDRAFTGLMRSPERRGRMARVAAALCDGRGAERAAGALLQALA